MYEFSNIANVDMYLQKNEWFRVSIPTSTDANGPFLTVTADCQYECIDSKIETSKCGNLVLEKKDGKGLYVKVDSFDLFYCSTENESILIDYAAYPVTLERFDTITLARKIVGALLITSGLCWILMRRSEHIIIWLLGAGKNYKKNLKSIVEKFNKKE